MNNIDLATCKKVLIVTFEVYFYRYDLVYELMDLFKPNLFLTDEAYFRDGLQIIKYVKLKSHFVQCGDITQKEVLLLKRNCEFIEINSEKELKKVLESLRQKNATTPG